jgi:plastocyanin
MDDESRVIIYRSKRGIVMWALVIVIVILASLSAWLFSVVRQNGSISSLSYSSVVVGNGTNSTTTVKQSIPAVGVISQAFVPVSSMADDEIDVTAIGFSPDSITISKGQSIVWTVRDDNSHWIESNPSSPYPEKGSCGSLFNTCDAIGLGSSFRMVFNDVGTWSYYDKLNPQFTGTVTVK